MVMKVTPSRDREVRVEPDTMDYFVSWHRRGSEATRQTQSSSNCTGHEKRQAHPENAQFLLPADQPQRLIGKHI